MSIRKFDFQKNLNIGTHEIIAVIILKLQQGGLSIQQCIQKM